MPCEGERAAGAREAGQAVGLGRARGRGDSPWTPPSEMEGNRSSKAGRRKTISAIIPVRLGASAQVHFPFDSALAHPW